MILTRFHFCFNKNKVMGVFNKISNFKLVEVNALLDLLNILKIKIKIINNTLFILKNKKIKI